MTAPPDVIPTADPVLQRLAEEITNYEVALDELPVAVGPAIPPCGHRARRLDHLRCPQVAVGAGRGRHVLHQAPPLVLRACITSHRTQPADIEILVDELERAVEA